MQSVPITTNVASSNPAHGEVYSIQYYVIKLVSDLRQVVLWFSPPIKLSHDITEMLLKVALNTINQPNQTNIFSVECRKGYRGRDRMLVN